MAARTIIESPEDIAAGHPRLTFEDMTAAQAEAILRAVENLERTERRKLAAARAQAVDAEIDDW